MTFEIRFVTELPDADAYHALMVEYFEGIVSLLSAAGGPARTAEALADKTLPRVAETLPPQGRLAFAWDAEGRIVGTASFRLIGKDTAEFKRMYVHPDARRSGLGSRLFEVRYDEAKAIGCRRIVADTVKGNGSMLSLYDRFGFRRIGRYEGNFNPPELDAFLVYLEHILPEAGSE